MGTKVHSIITIMLLTVSTLWVGLACAADKSETLKGTVTLGAGGYGIRLGNGKLIRFMGRGGNKVFAVCHNGDHCEITGVVVYDTKMPLFLSVSRVRKLAGPAAAPAVEASTKTKAAMPAPNSKTTEAPATDTAKTQQAKPTEADETAPPSQSSSPFLLDDSKQ